MSPTGGYAGLVRYPLSYARAFKPLADALGIGPARSGLVIEDGVLQARMGWAFQARLPLEQVVSATPVENPRWWWGLGAHQIGMRRWLINGTQTGLVEIRTRAPVKARMMGIPVNLSSLVVSPAEPEALLAALS